VSTASSFPPDRSDRRHVGEAVPVTNDRTLTLSYDEDAGQIVLEGLPCGPAGEAGLSIAEGVELLFDGADGRLSKVFIEAGEPGGPPAVAEPVLAAVASLFGDEARAAVERAPGRDGDPLTVTAPPPVMAALSRLARLDAVRFTSPVAGSPLWAVEAARLARQVGLTTRVNAETRRAVTALERADDASPAVLAAAADAIADLVQKTEPNLAARLRGHAAASRPGGAAAGQSPPDRSLTRPDVAAANVRPDGSTDAPPGWLDPYLIPTGIFRHALRPDAELAIRTEGDGLLVEARLAPGADLGVLERCRARLVDPANRSVLGAAPFLSLGDGRARATIKVPVPASAWVEVVDDSTRPVSSGQLHHIRRAMRWAQTALSAGRQVSAPADTEWAKLAAVAWEHCAQDWSAARDQDRAYLAAMRRAAICPAADLPEEPSAWAKEVAGRPLLVEEPFLAERFTLERGPWAADLTVIMRPDHPGLVLRRRRTGCDPSGRS